MWWIRWTLHTPDLPTFAESEFADSGFLVSQTGDTSKESPPPEIIYPENIEGYYTHSTQLSPRSLAQLSPKKKILDILRDTLPKKKMTEHEEIMIWVSKSKQVRDLYDRAISHLQYPYAKIPPGYRSSLFTIGHSDIYREIHIQDRFFSRVRLKLHDPSTRLGELDSIEREIYACRDRFTQYREQWAAMLADFKTDSISMKAVFRGYERSLQVLRISEVECHVSSDREYWALDQLWLDTLSYREATDVLREATTEIAYRIWVLKKVSYTPSVFSALRENVATE